MAPLTAVLRATADDNTPAGHHTGIQKKWIPLITLVFIVVLIIIVIFIPKTWAVNLYTRIRRSLSRTPKPSASTNNSRFSPFSSLSSRTDNHGQSRREDWESRPQAGRQFVEIHLHDLRTWKKPVLQNDAADRGEMDILEQIGLPLPALHVGKDRERVKGRSFGYSKTYGGFKQWMKDDKAENETEKMEKVRVTRV